MSIIHDSHDYEHVFCSVKRMREVTVFLVLSDYLSPASCDDCLYLMTRARDYGGPQDNWILMFWWSDIISGGLGPPDHRQS